MYSYSSMPAPRLRVLAPLLRARHGSTCAERSAPPPCPPCAAQPPPPCRERRARALLARRVVCCPPPQGARPPCAAPAPACALSCDNRIRQSPAVQPARITQRLCGAALDVVAQRLRDHEEHRRREYERAVAERGARPPPAPPRPRCPLPSPETFAFATDGRAYSVLADAPPPRCSAPAASPHPHPPPQPVRLAPLGDCRPQEGPRLDPCAHTPRTLLSIDRSAIHHERHSAAQDSVPEHAPTGTPNGGNRVRSVSPQPVHENPKNETATEPASSYKGITSRIMNSLRGGRGSPSPARSGACGKPDAASRAGDAGWCASPPRPAPAPPRCRPPSVAERLRRRPPSPCAKRPLHTAAVARSPDTPPGTTREATLTAAKKLAAALSERELLKEAGRGRVVSAPSCASPRPLRASGGALELSVPPGADTVCVRVSVGEAFVEPQAAPTPAPAPSADAPPAIGTVTAPCSVGPTAPSAPRTCPPPAARGTQNSAQSACSDSWLSIKKLQRKISSSCGRSEPPGAGARSGVPPATAAPPPPGSRPGPSGACAQGRAKMSAVLPHTIFVRS